MGFQHHKWWFTTGDMDPSIKHGGSHGALKPWFQVVIPTQRLDDGWMMAGP
jgi:hypothetical protein